MKLSCFRNIVFCALTLTLIAATAAAKNGRDFAGYYQVTNVIEQGDAIKLNLKVQLFNYSGADLKEAVVSVRSAHPGPDVLATFSPVTMWVAGSAVILSQSITVPRDVYEDWTSHGQPAITVAYTDQNQQEWQRTAQVNQRPNLPF